MLLNEIYSFSEADKQEALRLTPESDIADVFYANNGDEKLPIKLRYDKGNKLFDLVPTGLSSVYLFSPKAINLLIKNKVTGFTTYEVDLSDVPLKEIESYKALAIKGKSGPINHKLSKPATIPAVRANAPEIKTYLGMLFDEETWDGRDIFSPEGTVFMYVTKKFRDLFEENMITNCAFRPIREMENLDLMMGFVTQ